jgi:hypothetical protein
MGGALNGGSKRVVNNSLRLTAEEFIILFRITNYSKTVFETTYGEILDDYADHNEDYLLFEQINKIL